jgi:type I restriction enzyme M protein
LSETPDLVIGSGRSAIKYKMDLVPPTLIVARYFADQQTKLDELNAVAEEATRAVEEYTEEHAVEDGLLAAAMDDDKTSKVLATARLKQARHEGSDRDEIEALQHLIGLYNAEAVAKKTAKEAQAALTIATLKKYGDLTEADVQALVLDGKWAATVSKRIVGEVNALTLTLVSRMQQLGERYAATLEDLNTQLVDLESKVASHLIAMGVK